MTEEATISVMPTQHPPHEGEVLKTYLIENSVSLDEFAKRCGLKGASGLYANYFKKGELGDRAWQNARKALLSFGLDPSNIRPEPVATMNREKFVPPEELDELIKDWDEEHLRVLNRILWASQEAQFLVKKFLTWKLSGKKK